MLDDVESVRTMLDLLRVYDARSTEKIRVGRHGDGGYVMLPLAETTEAALSLGIGNDVSWDLEIAKQGFTVFQFDHTLATAPVAHENFRFFRSSAGRSIGCFTSGLKISDVLATARLEESKNLVLKFDIEDSEWGLILDETPGVFGRFSQIVGEFHGLLRARDPAYREIFARAFSIIKQSHEVIHVHGNNWAEVGFISNIAVPDVLEVSFARKSDYCFLPHAGVFPGQLDFPCHPDKPDIFLGSFVFR